MFRAYRNYRVLLKIIRGFFSVAKAHDRVLALVEKKAKQYIESVSSIVISSAVVSYVAHASFATWCRRQASFFFSYSSTFSSFRFCSVECAPTAITVSHFCFFNKRFICSIFLWHTKVEEKIVLIFHRCSLIVLSLVLALFCVDVNHIWSTLFRHWNAAAHCGFPAVLCETPKIRS